MELQAAFEGIEIFGAWRCSMTQLTWDLFSYLASLKWLALACDFRQVVAFTKRPRIALLALSALQLSTFSAVQPASSSLRIANENVPQLGVFPRSLTSRSV